MNRKTINRLLLIGALACSTCTMFKLRCTRAAYYKYHATRRIGVQY